MKRGTAAAVALAVAWLGALSACGTPGSGVDSAGADAAGAATELAALEARLKAQPNDVEARVQHARARERLLHRQLEAADRATLDDRLDDALAAYRQAQALDARHPRVEQGLAAIDAARRHQAQVEAARERLAAGDRLGAELALRAVWAENPAHAGAARLRRDLDAGTPAAAAPPPALAARLRGPVSLEFHDAPVRLVAEALARAAGINILVDRDVPADLRVSLVLRQVRIDDALDQLVANHALQKKVVSENAVLVYPATPQKLREHQPLVIRTFRLGHASAAQVQNMVRTLLKTRDLFVDERSNSLVMRDTPDAVRAAERLIAAQDRGEPEVMLEIEILEAARAVVREIGLSLPGEFAGPGGSLQAIGELNRQTIAVDQGLGLKLLRTDGQTRTLAHPRLRVRHREKARLHIGERVPVISSSVVGTAGGPGGATPVTTEQVQYLDVGIRLEAEPTVHPDDTVSVRLNVDVSALGTRTQTRAGTVAYEVGTRNATTVLRLRDGQTQALMGLIRDDDVRTGTGLPLVSEIGPLAPVFGRETSDSRSRELVLLVTPRLVQPMRGPDAAQAEFWSGTDNALRLREPVARTLDDETARAAALALPAGSGAPIDLAEAPLRLAWLLPPALPAGTELRLPLRIRALQPLKSTAVQMRFDPAAVQILGVDEGDFFRQGGRTLFAPRLDLRSGIVHATVGSVEGAAQGEGELLVLRLRARPAAERAVLQLGEGIAVDAEEGSHPFMAGAQVELAFQR